MSSEAQWYRVTEDKTVQCTLCPHECILKEGKAGFCRVRKNNVGKLLTDVYGFVSAINLDPIEKKPLYHYYPGSQILSIGSYGCNLRCAFCQNSTISQTVPDEDSRKQYFTPDQLVSVALDQPGNIGIAFTYNEPIVWYEYMIDIASKAKDAGLKTVMVTNGFINPEPLGKLIEVMDAFSVDLKAFTDDYYTRVTSSKLEPVKSTLRQIRNSGKHLEIVNLLVPGLNDDEESFSRMVKWIAAELGKETVFHISRYFPHHKLNTGATSNELIRKMETIARKELIWVYTGNMHNERNDTYCDKCNNLLITRYLYDVKLPGLNEKGQCKSCGNYFHKKT